MNHDAGSDEHAAVLPRGTRRDHYVINDSTAQEGQPQEVVIADHDPAVREFLERSLSQAGYHVHEAANGREVLGLIYRLGDRIALVVMDVDMPEMDGLRVLQSVTSFFPATRVLMIEEEPGDERERELLEAGADVFLAKPLDTFRLMEAVRSILPK